MKQVSKLFKILNAKNRNFKRIKKSDYELYIKERADLKEKRRLVRGSGTIITEKKLTRNLKRRKLLRGLKFLSIYRYKQFKKNFFTKRITIKITPNNIFCLVKNLKENKTEYVKSGGKMGLNISKRKVKFLWKTVITDLLEYIKQTDIKNYILTYSGPRRLKKKIFRFVRKTLVPKKKRKPLISYKYKEPKEKIIKNVLLINVNPKKIFNGCRVKKKKRKKRSGFRVFK